MQNNVLTIWLAIFAIFCIDFSINAGAFQYYDTLLSVLISMFVPAHTVQAVDRALLVDTLPTSEQADGNAWAARMLGIGSVAGYFVCARFPFRRLAHLF